MEKLPPAAPTPRLPCLGGTQQRAGAHPRRGMVTSHPGDGDLRGAGCPRSVGEHGTQGLPARLPNACGPAEALERSKAFLEYFCQAGARLVPARGISPVNK